MFTLTMVVVVVASFFLTVILVLSAIGSCASADFQAFKATIEDGLGRRNLVLVVLGVYLLMAGACMWAEVIPQEQGDPAARLCEGIYWSAQTMTTVGYGDGLHGEYRTETYVFAAIWMVITALYWACVGGAVVSTVIKD